MDFSAHITTPKNTFFASPKITTIHLTKGRLTGGFLFFPPGPAGTLHIVARIANHQILPFSSDENYHLDDCVIPFSLGINLLELPLTVDCVTWNDSTQWSHLLNICFFLSPSIKRRSIIKRIENAFSGTEGYNKK